MNSLDNRPKTIICDIDGTLILHSNPYNIAKNESIPILLEGTKDKLMEWEKKGYNLILLSFSSITLAIISSPFINLKTAYCISTP